MQTHAWSLKNFSISTAFVVDLLHYNKLCIGLLAMVNMALCIKFDVLFDNVAVPVQHKVVLR